LRRQGNGQPRLSPLGHRRRVAGGIGETANQLGPQVDGLTLLNIEFFVLLAVDVGGNFLAVVEGEFEANRPTQVNDVVDFGGKGALLWNRRNVDIVGPQEDLAGVVGYIAVVRLPGVVGREDIYSPLLWLLGSGKFSVV
jgi:hypothetical protein